MGYYRGRNHEDIRMRQSSVRAVRVLAIGRGRGKLELMRGGSVCR